LLRTRGIGGPCILVDRYDGIGAGRTNRATLPPVIQCSVNGRLWLKETGE
jgi:hypothetical protein